MAIKSPNCCQCNCNGADQLENLATGTSKNLDPGLGNAKWSADSKYIYYTSPRFKGNLSDIWIYDVATGMRLTHFAQYGVENDKTITGIVVFDLTQGTSHLWLNFSQEGILDWSAPSWDDAGKHLLFFGQKEDGELSGLWLGDLQTGEVRLLIPSESDDFCNWAWQPDGQWLAISCREHPEILSGIWLAEIETGKLLKTNLPDNAQIRGWVNPPP